MGKISALKFEKMLNLQPETIKMAVKEKYIDPFTDFGFKKLFGTELNKDLLIDFLNEVILPQHKRIADLEYRSNERMGQTEWDRKAIFDLYCMSAAGERFIVEMQKAKQNYFKDRSVYYSSFPIQEQAETGEWNYQLSPVYTVGILDFVFSDTEKEGTENLAKDPLEVRHEVQLKNQKGKVFYDKLTYIYLEMPHFTKTEEQLETTYDKWLFVLKQLPKLQSRPQKLQEKIFQKLFEAAEIAKFSPKEKEEYEESLKSYRDLKGVIDTAYDEGKVEGRAEGEAKGRAEGEAKGRAEGEAKGRIEEKTANIIKALKRGKLSVEEIAEDFGEPVEYILNIKAENNL
jgi:predicted transposase/invertase (TIGR01784 family)